MDSLNTVFFQGTNEEQIIEFASLIDQLVALPEGSEDKKVSELIQEPLENSKSEELFSIFIPHVATLLKVEDSNLIASFNFYIAQLKTFESEKVSEFIKKMTEVLISSDSENGLGKLAMLETLFNSIGQSDAARLEVLRSIIEVASKHKLFKAIANLLQTVKLTISKVNSDVKVSRELLLSLTNALKEGSYKKLSYESLLNYLYTFDTKDEVSEQVLSLAKRAILEAVSIREVLNFESLLQSLPVQCLAGQPIYEFAELFLTQDVSKYLTFISAHKELIQDPSFDQDVSLHKIRLLTVASLGAENLGASISYDTIAEALKLDNSSGEIESQVELFVIDVIRTGLVEAKLNQLDGNVVITRSTHRSFDKAQWAKLLSEFSSWKESLELVAKTVENSIASINSSSRSALTLPITAEE